jgi:alpha-L-fucosidase 2
MKHINKGIHTFFTLAALLLAPLSALQAEVPMRGDDPAQTGDFTINLSDKDPVNQYNVIWDSPSKDCHGSMPLGNGDISLNAWVEQSGELQFYIGKTDSWEDNARLAKVGKIRVSLDPKPVITPFRQKLSLADGTMKVSYGDGTELSLWVDANHPVIHVEVTGKRKTTATATIELWRTRQETLPSLECSDVMNQAPPQEYKPTVVEPDTILAGLQDRIGWYHRNIKSVGPEQHSRIQGMQDYKRADPLLHRTFGALVTAANPKRIDDTHLQSAEGTEHRFDIHVLTKHPSSAEEWLKAISALADSTGRESFQSRKNEHGAWWREFWNRSWINATSPVPPAPAPLNSLPLRVGVDQHDDAAYLSQMFALQRFITACAGRGAYPIKFNGSIFTVPAAGRPGNADYRQWGPGYWWQNTRLPYISMCANGDFEMMEPLWRMYVDQNLPLNKYRTKKYFGHDEAAYYVECIQFWGDVFLETYGWTPVEQREDKLQASGWHKWEWVAGPELVWMMLEAYDYTGDKALLQKRIMPAASAVMRFFENYYKTNTAGQLVMHPSQALETWWDCTDPMPEVAGLRAITERLLALPDSVTPKESREYWTSILAKLPPLPVRDTPSGRALAPAGKFDKKNNFENPELYAVFPFRLCSFEKENRVLGVNAMKHRWDRGNSGWWQDDIFAAYLGLTDEARRGLVERARNSDKGSRFPAFWGPNFDWVPDQDHGGVMMKAFQSMLLQTEGDKIFLLPAWPRNWDVSFKLHAPKTTVIEGRVRNGKLVDMKVTPASRRKNVVVIEPQ